MANISVNWATRVITIPKSFMTYISDVLYELDLDEFRIALKDIEDSEEGMDFPDTHRHNTVVTLGGITLARVIEIINGYTVAFENGEYAVNALGANSNLADVINLNHVSLRSFNAAGLILVSVGSGLSTEEHDKLMETAAEVAVEGHVADALIIYDPPTRAEVTSDKDEILAPLAVIELETDKIAIIKDETDKIQSVKDETDKIQDARDEIAVAQADILDLLSQVAFIKNVEGGKWQILGDEMIFYTEDNEIEIMRFTITRDNDGNPIMRTRI